MPHKRDAAVSRTPSGASKVLMTRVKGLADTAWMRACLPFFSREKQWINEQHLEVCRVPAPTFREQERADFLVRSFRAIGGQSRIDDAGNVVTPLVFEKGLPFVALTAHMDTALAAHHLGDVVVRPDGTFQGPGVTDNGSGLAGLLAVARLLTEAPPPKLRRNVLLVANVAEEGEGNLHGMNYLCRHSPFSSEIDAYLVLDGASTGHITAEALGSRRFEIIMEGHGGHSWNDFGRANPVHALGRTVAILSDAELPSSPRSTLSVGVIEGGSGVNSIAPVARAKVDIRSRSSAAMEQLVETLEEAVKLGVELENRRSTDRLSNYKIREIGHRPAAARVRNNEVVACFQAVDSHLGISSQLDCASTDANVPLSLGLPAAAVGAGGRGGDAHTPSEWFHPDGRELGLQRVLLALGLLMGTSDSEADAKPPPA